MTAPGLPGILGRVPDAAEFSSLAALPVLREACQQAGLNSDDAELLRVGENAIFRLASAPVVVRIGRSADRVPDAAHTLWALTVPELYVLHIKESGRRSDAYQRWLADVLIAVLLAR